MLKSSRKRKQGHNKDTQGHSSSLTSTAVKQPIITSESGATHKTTRQPSYPCIHENKIHLEAVSKTDEDAYPVDLCADATRAGNTTEMDDPMADALSVAVAARNAQELVVRARQESRLVTHLALKAQMRAENLVAISKSLQQSAEQVGKTALRLGGFESFEQAYEKNPAYSNTLKLEELVDILRGADFSGTCASGTGKGVSARATLKGLKSSSFDQDGLSAKQRFEGARSPHENSSSSKLLNRLQKSHSDDRSEMTSSTTSSLKQGFETYPTSPTLVQKDSLHACFDSVQAIDPIWEDTYYDDSGKV